MSTDLATNRLDNVSTNDLSGLRPDTLYKIYDDGELVDELTTDENGHLSVDVTFDADYEHTILVSEAVNLTWNTGDGTWDTSTTNWIDEAEQSTTYTEGDTATFDDTGSGGTITVQAGGVTPGSITISGTRHYTFGASNPINAGPLMKSGTGTGTLNNTANTFTSITLDGGTLQWADTGALGESGITWTDAAVLECTKTASWAGMSNTNWVDDGVTATFAQNSPAGSSPSSPTVGPIVGGSVSNPIAVRIVGGTQDTRFRFSDGSSFIGDVTFASPVWVDGFQDAQFGDADNQIILLRDTAWNNTTARDMVLEDRASFRGGEIELSGVVTQMVPGSGHVDLTGSGTEVYIRNPASGFGGDGFWLDDGRLRTDVSFGLSEVRVVSADNNVGGENAQVRCSNTNGSPITFGADVRMNAGVTETTFKADNEDAVVNWSGDWGVLSAAGATLRKTGPGILDLSGVNNGTYALGFQVDAGLLNIQSSMDKVAGVTVASGAVFGGSGTVTLESGESLSVSGGGTIAPAGADSAGTLTVNGDVNFGEGAYFDGECDVGAFDRVSVNGTLDLPSSATVMVTPLTGASYPDSAVIFSATNLTGAANLNGWLILGAPYHAVVSDGTNVVLEMSACPELNWTERSDWINVKTDVTPAAAGDGVTDDTAALQAALDMIQSPRGSLKTVYLPAGTYRITNTLVMTTRDTVLGGMIVGHGSATRILWDGEEGGRMLWSKNTSRIHYIGQVWDGNGKAAVGIDHASTNTYQTWMRHQHQTFVDFSEAGIRIENETVATAEVFYNNCLFLDCDCGVKILDFNDYDNSFDGCEFRECGTGIFCYKGSVYVRNCHFWASTERDIYTTYFGPRQSIRRCTSVDSAVFLEDAFNSVWGNPQVVQDCHVAGWTNPDGAIVLRARGPTTVFDCEFVYPPNDNPPIRLANGAATKQLLVHSRCATETSELVDPGLNSHVTEITNGLFGGSVSSASQSFFKNSVRMPGVIFDAKEDFGAVGDWATDDTAALQATIDAARTNGNGAMAYIPYGIYRVTQPLNVTGTNYFIGGSGFRGTALQWGGAATGRVLFAVHNPVRVVMEHLDAQYGGAIGVRQTGSGTGVCSIVYDAVYTQNYTEDPGFEFVDLPLGTRVHLFEVSGCMRFNNCSRAHILANVRYANGAWTLVEGADETERDGFLGMTQSLHSNVPYTLYVLDNQNFVATDFYCENSDRQFYLEGAADLPPGYVSISGVKTWSSEPDFVTITNYMGRFFHGGSTIRYNSTVTQTGANPVDIMFMGEMYRDGEPAFDVNTNAAEIVLVENILFSPTNGLLCIENVGDPEYVADALDDFRRLGAMDLQFNHPDSE